MKTETNSKPSLAVLLKGTVKRLSRIQLFQQRKLLTFFVFVLISAAFWFVRSMGEVYETEVSYPVRYINFPDNKILLGKVPEQLRLRVQAKGFNILKSKLNLNLTPIKFNVSSFSLNTLGTDSFYVVTSTVKDLLSAELDQITILDISPDTLFFRFTDMAVKKAGVVPVLALHDKFFQKQYMQNGNIAVSPDSIIISGPRTALEKINRVLTEPINLTSLSDTVRIQCNLRSISAVTFSQQKVLVSIPVDRFTEVDENLPVVPVNVPDSLNMIAVPGKVTITYNICLSNYDKLTKNPLILQIDYNALRDKQVTRLTVFLADTPKIISNIRINPKETEFLITRK